MLRALVTSVLFAVVVDFASVSPAVAQDARSQAIMACNAEVSAAMAPERVAVAAQTQPERRCEPACSEKWPSKKRRNSAHVQTIANASISTMNSGRDSRLTCTVVLVGSACAK